MKNFIVHFKAHSNVLDTAAGKFFVFADSITELGPVVKVNISTPTVKGNARIADKTIFNFAFFVGNKPFKSEDFNTAEEAAALRNKIVDFRLET
jgi:hypothetical protein